MIIISHTLMQNYNLFLYKLFSFLKDTFRIQLDIRKMSDIRLEEIAFSDIRSDTEYPLSGML